MVDGEQPIELTPEYVASFIAEQSTRRQGNRVLHGHPGQRHWKALDESAESLLEKRAGDGPADVNLYVGTPFCIRTKPARCGFCLFPSEDYTGKGEVESYLGYLEREFRLLERHYRNDRLSSVYFGGGTPNLYRPAQYATLMSYVDRLYGGIPEGIEITLEGLPPLFSEEKVAAMKAVGINRISMGAQQTGELIRHSGRPQTRKQVLDAIDLCLKHGMANSVDLIYGWPEQTEGDMLDDLKTVVEGGVSHITHYELSIAGPSEFARRRKHLLPSVERNRAMYHVAGDYLRGRGFEQVTVYDWRRIPEDAAAARLGAYEYESRMHRFDNPEAGESDTTRQVCGIGFAGISFHLRDIGSVRENWIFQNSRTTKGYRERLDAGRLPVEVGYKYSPEDVRLNWLYQTMQTMKIDGASYRELFGHDIRAPLGHVIDALHARGWLRAEGEELHFVGDGQYHIPMLQTLIASPRIAEITAVKRARRLADIPVAHEAIA